MKKIALSIVLVLLVSCQSTPVADLVIPSVPTNTILPATATSTVAPTSTPVPPTATIESYQDYVQTSENIFPLEGVENGLVDFTCTADFENIILKNYTTPDGMIHRAWVNCEDGGQIFVTELFLHNDKVRYFTTAGAASENITPSAFSDKFIINQNAKLMEATGVQVGKIKVKIIGGSNSEALLKYNNPFLSVFPAVNWDEAFLEFAQTGNYTKLPKIAGIDGYLLYGVRIQLKP